MFHGPDIRPRHAPSAPLARLRNCAECPIRPVSICSVLDRTELDDFAEIGRRASFKPRSVLFLEGDPADAIFNVTSGLVRQYRLLPNGRRQIVGFALPGDFLGLPPGQVHSFSADAAVASHACRFPRRAFLDFLESHPHLLRHLHDAAASALANAHEQLFQVGPRRADAKVASFILMMGRRWAHLRGVASPVVPLPMGRQDIGDYLGLTIATVSRTLHRLQRERAIEIAPGGVRIVNAARIEVLAGS
jgi:CRP/FNR family transcriptional regulator